MPIFDFNLIRMEDDNALSNRMSPTDPAPTILATNHHSENSKIRTHPSKSSLISLSSLPQHMTWMTDNPFLLQHHRPPTRSLLTCVRTSLSHFHTETLNIATHLIPTILFFCVLIYLFLFSKPFSFFQHSIPWEPMPLSDRFMICTLVLGVLVCFGLSSLFHIFSSHEQYGGRFLQADLFGIIVFGFNMTITSDYFLFYKHQNIFIAILTCNLFATLVCALLLNTKLFSNPAEKIYKSGLYTAYGVVVTSPPLACFTFRLFTQIDLFTYFLYFVSVSFSLGGGLCYALKFPESWRPGSFDVWGQSHTTMHICTTLGALFFYEAVLQTAQFSYI